MTNIKHVERSRHGLLKNGARPREYALWKMMIQRCCNPNSVEFKNYGARGVQVCDRWLAKDGFANFLADLGPQPFAGAGLCLRDSEGDFDPRNVVWALTRGTILTYEGRSMSLAAWAREVNMKPGTLRARLRSGWPIEAALSRYTAFRPPHQLWNRRPM